jgi:hypothetical protein
MNFAPVKPLRPTWQIALLAGGLAALIGLSGALILGNNAASTFEWQSWLLLGLAFAMAFGGAAWAAAQWMSPSGRCSFWKPVLGLGLACCGLALGSRLDVFVPAFAAICISVGSGFSIVTGLILVFVFRRTAPMMRQRVAAAAGVVSGMAGFLAIQLHCPNNEFWHMMFGHALLPVLWGLIGYWATRLAFR